jgi:DNA-binding transcriptional ArsR family regulator
MLRIHFTTEDLAKTRIATTPDPLWELSLSMHQLRLRTHHPLLTTWKREVTRLLHPSSSLRDEVAPSLALCPPRGYFPDFLTPIEAVQGFDAGLDAVLATPKRRLQDEIGMLGGPHRSVAPVVEGIGRGEARALNELGNAMRRYHQVALAPVWDRVSAAVDADRTRRTRQLVESGWAEVLGNLHPQARFANGTLEVGAWGMNVDHDLQLGGRGLLLVPSYFKEARQLMILADGELPPVLIYPIDANIRLAADAAHASVAALIGRTRANVLETAAASGGTTSEIALRLRISSPAASQHLSVLRQAGLVLSTRDQNRVFHTPTPLGRALLAGG